MEAAQSRRTISVAAVLAARGVLGPVDVSCVVTSSTGIVVERPMYFWYYDVWDGGHVSAGAAAPSGDWYFAEGFTG